MAERIRATRRDGPQTRTCIRHPAPLNEGKGENNNNNQQAELMSPVDGGARAWGLLASWREMMRNS